MHARAATVEASEETINPETLRDTNKQSQQGVFLFFSGKACDQTNANNMILLINLIFFDF